MELSATELHTLIHGNGFAIIENVAPLSQSKSHSLIIGQAYLIRTVTMYYTGRLVSITDSDIVLDDAAWIADTGRFSEALKTGQLSEVEPYPSTTIINRDTIIDVSPWSHELPRGVK